MDTSGFYRLDPDTQELYYGPNFVVSANYELYREQHSTYNYPVDGWYWFDSVNQARLFFNLPELESMA